MVKFPVMFLCNEDRAFVVVSYFQSPINLRTHLIISLCIQYIIINVASSFSVAVDLVDVDVRLKPSLSFDFVVGLVVRT
jgi:hypothetical protein